MYAIIWEFRPHPGREREFMVAYGPDGDWARLFAQARGFLGTELLHATDAPPRYLTIDRWESEHAFDAFRLEWGEAYAALDARCAPLTLAETRLGAFRARGR